MRLRMLSIIGSKIKTSIIFGKAICVKSVHTDSFGYKWGQRLLKMVKKPQRIASVAKISARAMLRIVL